MMWLHLSVYWLLSSSVRSDSSSLGAESENEIEKYYEKNTFDTYNADECPRVRRPWFSLSDEEKQLYANAMLKLREQGEGQMDKDELIAVGSEHMDLYGEVTHYSSIYLFWHNYLLWEIESRIRNLGGEYSCFAVPYWDFSTEATVHTGESPKIFQHDINHLGGTGNPDDSWTVNGYSWPGITTRDWWVPAHCTAEGDVYPLCSLKRSTNPDRDYMHAEDIGRGIVENADFLEFSKWYSDTIGIPMSLLTDDQALHFPVVTSYDPIWYLFHSMVSYHQGIWQDCHEYDQIAPEDLDQYEHAYSEYCDVQGCGDMSLDGAFTYNGIMGEKDWAFVSNEDLTVRKAYHQPRWNVIYDLEDGHGFYRNSGLMDFCKGKLNEKWFMLKQAEQDEADDNAHSEHKHKHQDVDSNDEVVLLDEDEKDVVAQRKGKGTSNCKPNCDGESDDEEMVLNAANGGYLATGIGESSNKLLAIGFVAFILMVVMAAWCFRAKRKEINGVLSKRSRETQTSHSYGSV